ncbi:peptide MFS transporter [Brevibacterium aurantiacum]|uniref:Proton-dependent oligopeptide transporter, POT family n=1 Tax=Brevibacterium aurantiacum TaxID=273384 RepID=A0A2H1J7F2_BREAU|nr:oligopeptide:H+ symporter [Brevibacterium aurantiacum]SMX83258.1 proton-dependent oligopeptide transporter, POT family [Brevibacterium aurantiacum]SMX93518.1 proton-dependent oligopeptide transporter, POT family [Brevibacterium aurantiacum]
MSEFQTVDAAGAAEHPSPEQPAKPKVKQPIGLFTLSSIEMWERFSFYGLQVILAYYIYYSAGDGGLGLTEIEALAIAGAYGGVVYLCQPVGAWFADRLIPARTMVMAGGVIIMSGHISLALIPGIPGLLTGLALITIGTGALTPNTHAMVGRLYQEQSPRRDSGYAIFYTGILIGALFGPLATGYLQAEFGFHYGFGAAAIGMAIGLVAYFLGRNTVPAESKVVPNPVSSTGKWKAAGFGIALLAAIAVLVSTGIMSTGNLNNYVLGTILVVSVAYFIVMLRSKKVTADERLKVKGFIPLFITGAIFWTMILQLFTTFAVYADTRVDLNIGGYSMPAAYISTFEVIAGIIAGPLIAAYGQKLAARPNRKVPSTVSKLALGFVLMTLTFGLFALFPLLFTGRIPLIPVIIGMIVMGITEVMYAPIGLSVASQLSPVAFNSQMMALWGLTTAAGASLSGFMGQLYSSTSEVGFFTLMTVISVLTAAFLYGMRSPLRRLGVA